MILSKIKQFERYNGKVCLGSKLAGSTRRVKHQKRRSGLDCRQIGHLMGRLRLGIIEKQVVHIRVVGGTNGEVRGEEA